MDRKMRNAGLTAKERRVEDAADHLSPALERDFADRRIAPHRRAVDQRIHAAECLQCSVDHSPGRLRPAEIGQVNHGAPALRFDLPRHGLCVLLRRFRMSRSEEHTSELQSPMRISYAVLRLKNKNTKAHIT